MLKPWSQVQPKTLTLILRSQAGAHTRRRRTQLHLHGPSARQCRGAVCLLFGVLLPILVLIVIGGDSRALLQQPPHFGLRSINMSAKEGGKAKVKSSSKQSTWWGCVPCAAPALPQAHLCLVVPQLLNGVHVAVFPPGALLHLVNVGSTQGQPVD